MVRSIMFMVLAMFTLGACSTSCGSSDFLRHPACHEPPAGQTDILLEYSR